MKYNLVVPSANEEVFRKLLSNSNGKLIIVSDNSFVVSNILNDLTKAVNRGAELSLYRGNSPINPESAFDKRVIILGSHEINDISRELIDDSYYVAMLNRNEDSMYSFDVTLSKVSECITSIKNTTESVTVSDTNKEYGVDKEILEALRTHNVVFIQNISDDVIGNIKRWDESTFISDSYENYYDNYNDLINDRVGCVVFRFDCPSEGVKQEDCKESINRCMAYGLTIICNTTWVKLFLEMSCEMPCEDTVDFTSTVIYNDKIKDVNGNQSIFSDYVDK